MPMPVSVSVKSLCPDAKRPGAPPARVPGRPGVIGPASVGLGRLTDMATGSTLDQHRGQWVAIDDATGEVRAAAASDDELYAILDQGQFGRVTVMRVPMLDDPIFIGLG